MDAQIFEADATEALIKKYKEWLKSWGENSTIVSTALTYNKDIGWYTLIVTYKN